MKLAPAALLVPLVALRRGAEAHGDGVEGAELNLAVNLVRPLVEIGGLEGDADHQLVVLDEGLTLADDVVRVGALRPGVSIDVVHIADDAIVLVALEVPLVHGEDRPVRVDAVVACDELDGARLLVNLSDDGRVLPASQDFLFHGSMV